MDGETPGFNPEEQQTPTRADQPDQSPQFSQKETEHLQFVKSQVEQGKVGGSEDAPSSERQFTKHPEPPDWKAVDPDWKEIPLEKRQEFQKLFGKVEELDDQEKLEEDIQRKLSITMRVLDWLDEMWEEESTYLEDPYADIENSSWLDPTDVVGNQSFKGDSFPRIQSHYEEAQRLLKEVTDRLEGRNTNQEGKYGDGFYTNTGKGEPSEILYRILEEQYPDLGVTVRDDATRIDGTPLPFSVATYIDPAKIREVAPKLHKLLDHPVMNVFRSDTMSDHDLRVKAVVLEETGQLPTGAGDRILAGRYERSIKIFSSGETTPHESKLAKEYQDKFASLGTTPFSREEIGQILLEKVVTPEFGPPKQTTG